MRDRIRKVLLAGNIGHLCNRCFAQSARALLFIIVADQFDHTQHLVAEAWIATTEQSCHLFETAMTPDPAMQVDGNVGTHRNRQQKNPQPDRGRGIEESIEPKHDEVRHEDPAEGSTGRLDRFDRPDTSTQLIQLRL